MYIYTYKIGMCTTYPISVQHDTLITLVRVYTHHAPNQWITYIYVDYLYIYIYPVAILLKPFSAFQISDVELHSWSQTA